MPDITPLDERLGSMLGTLSPAEQRVARFVVDNREAILLGSAAQIAAQIGTSDATVVRAAQSLGFQSLSALREAVLADLTSGSAPSARLGRTLDEAGPDAACVLRHVVAAHELALQALRTTAFEDSFNTAVEVLSGAGHRYVFGVGPSGALADYATLQFNRIGLPTSSLSVSGIALADRLLGLRDGDAILMIAYAPVYREVAITIEEAERAGAPVLLVTDSLASAISDRVAAVLPVPRGRADHLALHGATLVLIEAMIAALAARDRTHAMHSLERLSALRGSIDKAWLKRGVMKSDSPSQ